MKPPSVRHSHQIWGHCLVLSYTHLQAMPFLGSVPTLCYFIFSVEAEKRWYVIPVHSKRRCLIVISKPCGRGHFSPQRFMQFLNLPSWLQLLAAYPFSKLFESSTVKSDKTLLQKPVPWSAGCTIFVHWPSAFSFFRQANFLSLIDRFS